MSKHLGLRLDRMIPGLANMPNALRLKVGVLEGATNEDGESVAFYAAKNEFGTKDIPPRPAMWNTLITHEKDYMEALAWMLETGSDPEQALRELGEVIAGDIKDAIAHWKTPPNSKKYAEWKAKTYNISNGGNQPLYLTGAYNQSIDYTVEKE